MSLEGTLDATSADGTVQFTLTVENTGDDPVTAQFSNGCRADVAVVDDGTEVWRYTDGRMFTQVLGSEEFDPGETRTFDVEWDDPTPGSYTAVGELTAANCSCEAETTLSI